MIRLAVPDAVRHKVEAHLQLAAPREEGCFCLLREGRGREDRRLLVGEPILPPRDGWESQRDNQLRPSGQWLSAVISAAINAKAGLLFIHSHPSPRFPAGFSRTDERALAALGETIAPTLDGPFAAAVVHPTGWVAVMAEGRQQQEIETVSAIGRTLVDLGPDTIRVRRAGDGDIDARQRDALGQAHDRLQKLHVGVVGAGGLGSPIAEQVARMGVASIAIVDDDLLDTPSNVRRVVGSTASDLRATLPPPKVDVVARHIDGLGLVPPVRRIRADVREEDAFRSLLDCDVVLAATDTHGSRATINELASVYLMPVIDVGVRAGTKADGRLSNLVAEVRTLTPTTPCLWCREVVSAEVIRAENLPRDQREELLEEGYLPQGLGEPAPSVVALTFLGASLATSALIALVSEEGEVAPSAFLVESLLGFAREMKPTEPDPACRCQAQQGLGDSAAPAFLPAKETHGT